MKPTWDYYRHTLLFISPEGRRQALAGAAAGHPAMTPADLEQLLGNPRIPGIVRRQGQIRGDIIEVGFSSPLLRDGMRLRAWAEAAHETVERVLKPDEILQMTGHMRAAGVIAEIRRLGEQTAVRPGVYGSTALEAVTGLPYTRAGSDLDIYAVPETGRAGNALRDFHHGLLELERYFAITIDCEVEVSGGYGVKLKELFSGCRTVLGKGLYDAVLLDTAVVLAAA